MFASCSVSRNQIPFSAWPGDDALDVDTPGRVSFNAFDNDSPTTFAPGYGMTFDIVKLPNGVKLYTNPDPDPNVFFGRTSLGGLPVAQGDAIAATRGFPFLPSWYYQLELTALASTCGESEMTYTISDQTTTSQLYSKKLNVICPRVCSLSDDVDWEESVCDQSTLTRYATANWRNFSLSGNASGSCDLPRAPDLPGTVKFDCDAIDLDSSWAVNLVVAGAILATAKVGFLVYALVHREAPIYQKAQVSTPLVPASTSSLYRPCMLSATSVCAGLFHIVHDSRWHHGRLCSSPPARSGGHVALPLVRLVVAHCDHAPVRHGSPRTCIHTNGHPSHLCSPNPLGKYTLLQLLHP